MCICSIPSFGGLGGRPQPADAMLINPSITARSSETVVVMEGCLSIPSRHWVKRHKQITVTGTKLDGTTVTFTTKSQLESQCWQHEIDHLDGVLITDREKAIPANERRGGLLSRWLE